MKTKIQKIRLYIFAITACCMSLVVLMSAAHAKDVARASHPVHVSGLISRPNDINAKAIGDLHNHIDKQTLKNISMDNPQAARERELKLVTENTRERNIFEMIEEMIAFYRLAFAMRLSLAVA